MTKEDRFSHIRFRTYKRSNATTYIAPGMNRAAKGWGFRMTVDLLPEPEAKVKWAYFPEELRPSEAVREEYYVPKAILRDTHLTDRYDHEVHYLLKIMLRWEDPETFRPNEPCYAA